MINYLKTIEKYSDTCFFKTLDCDVAVDKSYTEYLRDIRTCAYLLEKKIGNVDGRHIGIIAHSSYEYLVLFAAILFSRGVVVPINENETDDNMAYAVKNADVDCLIVANDPDRYEYDNVTVLLMDSLLARGGKEKEVTDFSEDETDRLAIILHTSGTTSLSKGVELSVDNVFHDYLRVLPKKYYDNLKEAQGAKVYTNYPFYHLAGLLAWMSFSENGCTICYSKEPKNVLADLEKTVIDFAAVVPATLKLWMTCLKRDRMDRLGMVKHIISGGAIIEPDMVRFFKNHGITVGQYYGQTEAGGAVTCNFDMDEHIDSIGQAVKGAKISIVDGEICIDYWGNMQGYYNNPEETKECLRDGIIYSGDLGYIDDEGYVYITGRKKNLIILSGGENVSPEEIERKLYENPLVQECRVYEQNDSIYADIYAPGMDEDGVKCYVKEINQSMPIYKRIKHVQYKECELEKTSIGKIKR